MPRRSVASAAPRASAGVSAASATISLMRGSDAVQFLAEVLPRRWVQIGLGLLVAGMLATRNYGPVAWFIHDVAKGLQEHWAPVLESIISGSLPTPMATP